MSLITMIHVLGENFDRDSHGLALSSRNKNLKLEEKKNAIHLFSALNSLRQEIIDIKKESNICKKQDLVLAKENALNIIINNPLIKVDYFEVIDEENFRFATEIKNHKNYRILIAAYVGKIRLIDNMLIE